VETLRVFGERQHITFPMLADPRSGTIRAFGMIDPDNSTDNIPEYGDKNTAYPGYFWIDRSGVVRERFVDAFWGDRRSGQSLLARMFPELVEKPGPPAKAAHLTLATGQTDRVVSPGTRTTIFVDIDLPKGMHLYAPGVEGYTPLALELDLAPYFEAPEPAVFPEAEVMRLEAIHETLPVFRGKVRIRQDVYLPVKTPLLKFLGGDHAATKPLEIKGRLKYQACDRTVCYPPSQVPVTWEFTAHPADFKRTMGG
jgi:hypothetical protein